MFMLLAFAGLLGWIMGCFYFWSLIFGEYSTLTYVFVSISALLYTPAVMMIMGIFSTLSYSKEFEEFLASNPGLPQSCKVEFGEMEDQIGFTLKTFYKGTVYFDNPSVSFEVRDRVTFNVILQKCKNLNPEFQAEDVPGWPILNSTLYEGSYKE